MSIIDPLSCGYAKVAAYHILTRKSAKIHENEKQRKSRTSHQQYNEYKSHFVNYSSLSKVEYVQFRKCFPKLVPYVYSLNKRKKENFQALLRTFSEDSWMKLPGDKQLTHTLLNCQGCLKSTTCRTALATLPIKSTKLKHKAETAGLFRDIHLKKKHRQRGK